MSRAHAAVRSPGTRKEVDQAQQVAEVGGTWLARLGLAGRGGFYLLLTYLTARLAVSGSSPRQANASGAMATVAQAIVGQVVLGAIALGLFALGVESLVGAWRDRDRGWPRRAVAACRGAFYLAMSYVPCSFLAGNHQTGSEQAQRKTTGRLLGLAFGQVLVAVVGFVVVVVCAWQVYSALRQKPIDRLDLARAPAWLKRGIAVLAGLGVAARAVTILPVGVFLIVAAIEFNPNRARGLDGELADLAGNVWGRVLLFVIAAGLAVFAAFSFVEARYRNPERP